MAAKNIAGGDRNSITALAAQGRRRGSSRQSNTQLLNKCGNMVSGPVTVIPACI